MRRTALAQHPAEAITRHLAVSFSDDPEDTLNATVRVTGLSAETREAITGGGVQTEEEARQVFAQALVELVVTWDMVEEDGTPTPLTLEELSTWPLSDLATLVFRLVEEVRGVPFETLPSSGG